MSSFGPGYDGTMERMFDSLAIISKDLAAIKRHLFAQKSEPGSATQIASCVNPEPTQVVNLAKEITEARINLNSQLIASVEEEEDDDFDPSDLRRPPPIMLKTRDNSFCFIAEQGAPAGKWRELAEACFDGASDAGATLDWNPWNGETCITIHSKQVEFIVCKTGNGCGGTMRVLLPAHQCIEAFHEAAQLSGD